MRRSSLPCSAVLALGLAMAIAACTSSDPVSLRSTDEPSPSSTTAVLDEPANSDDSIADDGVVDESLLPVVFANPVEGLTDDELAEFITGQGFFNEVWTPVATNGRSDSDGLGPLFNAESCVACHPANGRRRVPPQGELTGSGLVVRLSIPGRDPITGGPVPEPAYGDQLQDRATGAVEPEGAVFTNYIVQSDFYADGTRYDILWPTVNIRRRNHGPLTEGFQTSARIGSQMIGMGLLELIPQEEILALADPSDANNDGISGRANAVWNPQTNQVELGRFGWKANVVALDQQIAQAFHGDLGVTSTLIPFENCAPQQTACDDAPSGGTAEVSDEKLQNITNYLRTLGVPPARTAESEAAQRGEQHFREFGCTSCHIETFTTGSSPIEAISNVEIRPYTDMLLHDMGFDMSDSRPDFAASPIEWRTAPLWGLGLVPVDGDRGLLHDGRARTIEEAVLWHGGEAQRSRNAFINAELAKRQELLAFLESL